MSDSEAPSISDLSTDVRNWMNGMDPDSQAYKDALDSLQKLERIETEKETVKSRKKLSADAVLGATTSVVSILAILHAEKWMPVASKALQIATKIRI